MENSNFTQKGREGSVFIFFQHEIACPTIKFSIITPGGVLNRLVRVSSRKDYPGLGHWLPILFLDLNE